MTCPIDMPSGLCDYCPYSKEGLCDYPYEIKGDIMTIDQSNFQFPAQKDDYLPYGNGCKLYLNCFTCPLPDCKWIHGNNRVEQQRLIDLEKPFLERVLSKPVGGKG